VTRHPKLRTAPDGVGTRLDMDLASLKFLKAAEPRACPLPSPSPMVVSKDMVLRHVHIDHPPRVGRQ
jgi:hypothetical protein